MSFVLKIFLFILIIMTKCKCDYWEYKLVHDLLNGYDSSIRPSLHHNLTLNVTFGLALAQLIDVDEKNMIVTTNCWLNQGWLDPKLTWNPDSYDGIKTIHIPIEKIWKPDIILINNADSLAKSSSISTNAIIKYNGNVTWLSTVIFKSSCSINVRYFPFDQQSCDMIFASWTFHGFLLDINVNSNEGDVTNYMKNGEWHLVKLMVNRKTTYYSCCEEPYPEIHYKLMIRRRPLFYVFNMVFPCLLITLVAFLGFYLPPGSGEKVNMGITTLLSITVFLMLVAESMPPTSDQLPLLGIYYGITIGIVSFSTLMTVVTLNINNKGLDGQIVPPIVKKICFDYIAAIFRIRLRSKQPNKATFKTTKCKTNGNGNIPFNSKNYYVMKEYETEINNLNKKEAKRLLKQNENLYKYPNSSPDPNHRQQNGFLNEHSDEKVYKTKFEYLSEKMKSNSTTTTTTTTTSTGDSVMSSPTGHVKQPLETTYKRARDDANKKLDQIINLHFGNLINSIKHTIDKNEMQLNEHERREQIQAEWSDIARILDRTLCYLFSVSTICTCGLIFLNSPHSMALW